MRVPSLLLLALCVAIGCPPLAEDPDEGLPLDDDTVDDDTGVPDPGDDDTLDDDDTDDDSVDDGSPIITFTSRLTEQGASYFQEYDHDVTCATAPDGLSWSAEAKRYPGDPGFIRLTISSPPELGSHHETDFALLWSYFVYETAQVGGNADCFLEIQAVEPVVAGIFTCTGVPTYGPPPAEACDILDGIFRC